MDLEFEFSVDGRMVHGCFLSLEEPKANSVSFFLS